MTTLRDGDVLLGRYQVLEAAGDTALYTSFRARDLQGSMEERQADTVLKVIRAELAHDQPSRSFLLRELHRVRALSHPGLIRPAEVMLHEELRCVVLAEAVNPGLSQGVSLHRMFGYRRREHERFALDEVRKIGVQLAPTLSHVHGLFLCHGDLRMESVLLRPDGVKLCDVGIGRALPRGPYLDAVRQSGTNEVLAPEVVAGRPPDVRSDVFALAALYRHLLSLGERAGWEAFCAEKPALSAVLTRSLSENPEQRHQAVEELVAELEAVSLIGGPLRRRPGPTPLAMAVAAGRLPQEELNRPVEDLVPENRRRRNSGAFEIGSVLLPLASSPSGRSSIGSLPPSSGKSIPPAASSASGNLARAGKSIPPAARSAASARSTTAEPERPSRSTTAEPERPSRATNGGGAEGQEEGARREPRLSNPAVAHRGRRSSGAGGDAISLVSVAVSAASSESATMRSPAQGSPALPGEPRGPAEPSPLRPAPQATAPRAAALDDDVGGMATRPVTKADLDEVQRLAGPAQAVVDSSAAPSGRALRPPLEPVVGRAADAEDDIGGMHTTPFTRLGADPQQALQAALQQMHGAKDVQGPTSAPAAAVQPAPVVHSGLRPLVAPPAPEPTESAAGADQTIEQARLDLGDVLEGLVSRPPLVGRADPGDQPTNAFERLADVEISSAPPRRPEAPVDFSELPPLSHEPPRPLREDTPPSASTAPPRSTATPVQGAERHERAERPERRGPVSAVPVITASGPISRPQGEGAPPAGMSYLPRSTSGAARAEGEGPPAQSPSASTPVRRVDGRSTSGRVSQEQPPATSAGAGALHISGKHTRSGPSGTTQTTTTRKRRRGPGKLAALGALVVSALIGAITAVGLVTLFRGRQESTAAPDGAVTDAAPGRRSGEGPKAQGSPSAAVVDMARPSARPDLTRPAPIVPHPVQKGPAPEVALAAGACPAGMVSATGAAAAAFCIDKTEFPGAGQPPRVNVSAAEAEAACRQQGRRLCTGDEWEAACRGKARASYPYGPEPRPGVCNTAGGRIDAAGSHPGCASASGALDMAGNVAEWVRGTGVRGGSALGDSDGRCSRWLKAPPGGRSPSLGFRCCR